MNNSEILEIARLRMLKYVNAEADSHFEEWSSYEGPHEPGSLEATTKMYRDGLLAACRELVSSSKEREADSKRLDFLQNNSLSLCGLDSDLDVVRLETVDPEDDEEYTDEDVADWRVAGRDLNWGGSGYHIGEGKTLREAIDNAMAPSPTVETEPR